MFEQTVEQIEEMRTSAQQGGSIHTLPVTIKLMSLIRDQTLFCSQDELEKWSATLGISADQLIDPVAACEFFAAAVNNWSSQYFISLVCSSLDNALEPCDIEDWDNYIDVYEGTEEMMKRTIWGVPFVRDQHNHTPNTFYNFLTRNGTVVQSWPDHPLRRPSDIKTFAAAHLTSLDEEQRAILLKTNCSKERLKALFLYDQAKRFDSIIDGWTDIPLETEDIPF